MTFRVALDAGAPEPHWELMAKLRLRCEYCGKPIADARTSALAWFTLSGYEYLTVTKLQFEHNECAFPQGIDMAQHRFGRMLWLSIQRPHDTLLPFVDQYRWEGVPREKLLSSSRTCLACPGPGSWRSCGTPRWYGSWPEASRCQSSERTG